MRQKRIIDFLSQTPLHTDAAHFISKYFDTVNNRQYQQLFATFTQSMLSQVNYHHHTDSPKLNSYLALAS